LDEVVARVLLKDRTEPLLVMASSRETGSAYHLAGGASGPWYAIKTVVVDLRREESEEPALSVDPPGLVEGLDADVVEK